jgi:hypothetical protein
MICIPLIWFEFDSVGKSLQIGIKGENRALRPDSDLNKARTGSVASEVKDTDMMCIIAGH